MLRSEAIDDIVVSLDVRRAQLRRRRRRDEMREWAGLAAVTAVGVWLAVVALMTLLAH
jgi:tetrahydromethanopterin S-methyltransferase subunit B